MIKLLHFWRCFIRFWPRLSEFFINDTFSFLAVSSFVVKDYVGKHFMVMVLWIYMAQTIFLLCKVGFPGGKGIDNIITQYYWRHYRINAKTWGNMRDVLDLVYTFLYIYIYRFLKIIGLYKYWLVFLVSTFDFKCHRWNRLLCYLKTFRYLFNITKSNVSW